MIVLITSEAPPSGKARLKASTRPSGFLRRTTLWKSNRNKKTKPSGSPNRSRAGATPAGSSTGTRTCRTGLVATASSASAMWRLAAQISSTYSKALAKRDGKCEISQNHIPTVYRSRKKPRPTSRAKTGSTSALMQTRLTG